MDLKYHRRVKQIARIKRLVYEAGLTFSSIERANKLCRGALYDCVGRYPNSKVEPILAAALGRKVQDLFPDRYSNRGVRLPRVQSEPVLTVAQRRKVAGAQT